MDRTMIKRALLPALKTAVGAELAILTASGLRLSSAMTAGIIAVLSIRTTKRETWRMALEKLLAFVCANVIAFACFAVLGYSIRGFAVYLFLFSVLCIAARWEHALTPISVLVTHYVLAEGMPWALVGNEALLLLIGSGLGMLINLTLRPDAARMDRLAAQMDRYMVAALHALADQPDSDIHFTQLDEALKEAAAMAERNIANRILGSADRTQQYVQARRLQYDVLLQMRMAMLALSEKPPQYDQVCSLLHTVADQYGRDNDVTTLLELRTRLLQDMRRQPLPDTRPEFESRAILYIVLLRLEDFLLIKRDYYEKYMSK